MSRFFLLLPLLGSLCFGQVSPDTSLIPYLFHENYLQQDRQLLSNIGSPYYRFIPEVQMSFSYARLREERFLVDFTRNLEFQGKSISQLYFRTGSKKDQQLNIRHQQRLASTTKMSLLVNTLTSEGFYQNERTVNNNFRGEISHLDSTIGTISLYGESSSSNLEENGGVVGVLGDETSRDAIDVNLTGASNLNKRGILGGKLKKKFVNNSVTVDFSQQSNRFRFEDSNPDSAFYISRISWDSVPSMIFDSVRWIRRSGVLSWDRNDSISGFQLISSAMFTSSHHKLKQLAGINEQENDTVLSTEFVNNRSGVHFLLRNELLEFKASYERYFSGFNEGNYTSSIGTKYRVKNDEFDLAISRSEVAPEFVYTKNFNSIFNWQFNRKGIRSDLISLRYLSNLLRTRFKLSYLRIQNFRQLDTNAVPIILDGANLFMNSIISEQIFWRKLHLDLKATYLLGDKEMLRVPELFGSAKLYYRSGSLKNSGRLSFGANLRYITSYKSMEYFPVLQNFYLSDRSLDRNFFVDFWFTLSLNNAHLIFEVTHLNSDFGAFDYNSTSDYFFQDRSIKFGVIWNLYN
ncbi:MAG: putative porin [Flavobacteriales bacterium]|nr:putative porin [Flavobacteriales bacterium]